MPSAPRFTQKPSIQQTTQGDLLMECLVEGDPTPTVKWHHGGQQLFASSRVVFNLDPLGANVYKATLVIKEPNADDGGAYKCTASNQLGESNANINLNFAGTDDRAATPSQKGPTFIGKPKIIPKDGGALILMECKVRSVLRPVAKWSKDGETLSIGSTFQDVFADLGNESFLCQLEIRRPTANEAGQYRCNIRNDLGETNANLSLNFQQEDSDNHKSPGQESASKKHLDSTPLRRHKSKSREGSPRKSIRSHTGTPTQDLGFGNTLQPESAASSRKSSRGEFMDTSDGTISGTKRKSESGKPPASKRDRSRSKSPAVLNKKAPVVIQQLSSKTARSEETIVLQCELLCDSSTKVTWSRDGRTLQNSYDYSSSFDGKLAKLEIRQMDKNKAGQYKCVAENNHGETQSTATIKFEDLERRKSSLKGPEEAHNRKAKNEDQVVPEKQRVRIQEDTVDDKLNQKSLSSSKFINDEVDEIPSSGLKISDERRKELLKMSGGGDSDDEISESISEAVPTKSALKKSSAAGLMEVNNKNNSTVVTQRKSIKQHEIITGKANTTNSKKAVKENGDGISTGSVSFLQVGQRGSDSRRNSSEPKDRQEEMVQQNRRWLPSKPSQKLAPQVEQKQVQPFYKIQLKKTPQLEKRNSIKVKGQNLKEYINDEESDSKKNSSSSQSRRDTYRFPQFDLRDPTLLEQRHSVSPNMGRRSSVHMRRDSLGEILDKPTTPLKPIGNTGTPARILEIPENVTVFENELAILKCVIEGNPAPTYTWSKNGREVMSGGRVRTITDGELGNISLIIGKCRAPDEGEYTLTVKNQYGTDSVDAKLLITSETGLDFRAMLKKRESRPSIFDKSDSEQPKSEAQRRQSLFPGKKTEKWDIQLPEKANYQQLVHRVAELKCIYSRPNAKIRWYKDRKEIFSGGLKYKILINKAEITLVINNPDKDDSGKYTCEANGVQTHSLVTVEEPPMKYVFLTPLPNTQEVYRTKQGILSCKVNSARAPLVWHCGGVPIDVEDKRFVIEKDAVGRFTLTIKTVEQVDQAEWTAKINNEVYSKVMVYVEEPRDTFVSLLKSQRAPERDSATFECDVNDKDVKVEWWHDGQKIALDARRKEEKVGRKRRLIISQTKLEDYGEYKCTTKDDMTMAQLIVEALNKFLLPLQDVEVFERVDVNLRCETKDTKTPGIWYRNGKLISSMPGGKYETQSRAGVHTVKISKIEINEADTYEIDVNGLRGACLVTVLEAEKKPQLNWKPQKIECEAGKLKKILVPFQIKGTRCSNPKPVLYRNGKPVDLNKISDLIEVVINGDVAEIILKNPHKTDTGKWALELTNSGGSSGSAPFELFVKDKPKPPKGPLETTNVTAKDCLLKWKSAESDDASPTRGYVVEMQEGRSGKWIKIGTSKFTDFQVKDLKEHGEYKFRIKAVNDIGESEPLTGETILAKNPYNVPGKPKNMEAVDISADSLTLQWKPPESDGGASIESYIVERRDKSDKEWNVVGQVKATDNGVQQLVDNKVAENKEYYYRIKAVNKAGLGDPCDHGKAHKIQAKPAPPCFVSGGIQDLRLKVGETIKYDIAIGGEPTPTVSWLVNDKPLKVQGRIKMSTERGRTILKVENAFLSDSGKYTITLKNKSGTVESTANVTVVGRPSPPKGLLGIENIHFEGATILWNPPENDGGEPILQYIVEAQDIDNKNKFIPVGIVPASQLSLNVKGLKEKKNYKFRVKAVNKEGESDPLVSDKHVLIKNPWDEPGKPGRPYVIDVDANEVSLAWDPPSKDGGAPIEEYILEKKELGSKEWKQCAVVKLLNATINDLDQNKNYQFRVSAKNKAGVGAPSEPGDKVLTEPKYIPAWLDHGSLKNIIVKAGQTVRWNVKFGGKPPPSLQWTKNQNSIDLSSSVQIDTQKNDHTILCIPAAFRTDRGKYSLKVWNLHGKAEESADLTILDKPSKPRGPLKVNNVTSDACDLNWMPSEDDGGESIEFYEVEKMDTKTGRWVPCAKVKDCKAEIKGLKKGQSYQFRVKAVNKEGNSAPLTSDDSIFAKDPYDIPGKCTAPEIVDWNENSADLEWDIPKSDGGAPITDYIIEKKSRYGRDWQECAKIGPNTKGTVHGLKEGEEYEFRVRAVNKAGPSEPSDSSRTLIAKARFLKPHIDRSAMQRVTIKVGQNVDFKVPVSGEPPPKCVWTFADKHIGNNDPKIRISNEDYKTHFVLRNATREHAGKYFLTATNDSGVDSYGVEVLVLGRPLAPGGPIDVLDVSAEQVTIHWKPPADDGGTPVNFYEIEKMDMSTGRWLPCSRSDNPHAVVKNLQPGHEYQFRVRAVNNEGESDNLTSKNPTLAKNPFDAPDKIEKPAVVDWDKDHIDLEWKTPNDGGAPIEKYIIEKKDSNGHWSEAEIVSGEVNKATVKKLKQGEKYQFRITAKNKGGLSDPSDPSDSVIAKPRHLAPYIHREDLEDFVIKVGGQLKFNVNIDGEPAPKVTWTFNNSNLPKGIEVNSEKEYLSKFNLIKGVRNQTGSYTINATNDSGTDSVTIKIFVKGRPLAPKGPLKVSNVFENNMTLDWEPPQDDGGDPVDHYEIERQDTRDGIWLPVGRSTDAHAMVDGLKKGSHYQFRVKAVNSEGKSDPLDTEDVIQAKNPYEKPDKPEPPVPIDWDSDHIDLKWDPPNDGGAPIEEYEIEKRSKYGRWEPAIRVAGSVTTASVLNLTPNEKYEFRLIAINKGGPSDPSDASKSVIAKPKNLAPKISPIAALKLKSGQSINLDAEVQGEPVPTITWYYPNGSEIHQGGRVKLDNEDYHSKLQIRSTGRDNTGTYVVKAINKNGEDTVSVKITVVDKPSKPEGPLNVTNIHANYVNLDWKPTSNDGGTPIKNYVVEKLDLSNGRWVPALKISGENDTKCVVDGLNPGHDYKFRVVAVNEVGESEPLETLQKIVTKEPFNPPSKSGKPELTDWGNDFAYLKWTPPFDDGGAPIEEYIVELKEKFSSQWKPAVTVTPPIGDSKALIEAKVTDLTSGKEYEFRVVAKNKAGKGVPSDPSDNMIAKDRNVPPLIDRSAIEEIRVRVGQSFNLDIPVSGEPPPNVKWDYEKKPLDSDDRIKIDNIVYRTRFVVKRALRNDTGIYNITATNKSGKDVAQVHVVVLDRPSEPLGPLKISDVNKSGCILDWNEPADDGGAGISHYVIEKMDLATGRYVACGESVDPLFVVNDLTPGHEYKFCVKSVNKYGESDPLESQKSIIARNLFDTADRPGTPEIIDWGKDFADLKWTPPTDDGGAALEKFIVEKKLGNGDWEFATEVPGNNTDVKVENLIPGKTYQFRVKAINKAGESAPSNPSQSMLAKTRKLAPKIDRQMMSDIRIKCDSTINLNVNVEGEPNPKIQWFINGTPLTTSHRTRIDNTTGNNTKLATKLAERIDSGRYKLVASNEYGTDEYEIEVVVLDVSGEPKGPLDAHDVTKDSATLKWYAPEDDGGSPITHYIVEKQEDNGRWVPCGESSNTSLRVGKLNEGHNYKFRVKAVNRQGESKALISDTPITAKNPYNAPGKPQDVNVVDWDKDYMDLEWKPPISDGGAPIDSYIIEKKDKFGDWTPCVNVSGEKTTGTATGLIPGEAYQFRVIALNKSGKGDPSDPTDPKYAKPRKLAAKLNLGTLTDIRVRAGQPINLVVEFEGEPEPIVTWTINENEFSGNNQAFLENTEKLSQISISSTVRSDAGVYSITVQNEYGVDKGKCNVLVLDVPGSPEGPVSVSNIHKDSCKLNWKPPLDNGGSEIMHYIVEKMDTSRGTWQEVGQFPNCEAKVTKLTPNKQYLFRVKAVNLQGESKSLETENEIIAKNLFDIPDAPEAPAVTDWDEHRIDIIWQPPANDGGAPIKKYIVEKREKSSTLWVEVGHTPGTTFSTTGLQKGFEYEFRVIAVNDAGPSDPSLPSALQITKARFLKPKILTQIHKYKIKAGYSLNMEIEFVGTPNPTVNWQLQNIGSLASELIVDKKHNSTTIFFPSAKRSESGFYQLNIKNEIGEDEGVFEVVIQDRPFPPKGPLTVDNITKESCSLTWSPPEDDGGSEITNYVVERREIHSNAWVPVSNFVVGTFTTVSKLHNGHEYEFRVFAENSLGRSDPLTTDLSVVIKDPYGTPGKPGKPIITEHDVNHIDIEWDPPRDNGGNPITHYDIERKDKKTGRWIKVNTSPVHGTKFCDDRVQSGHAYEYRVKGVNKAGQGQPSDSSELAWAKPQFQEPRFELDIDGKEIRVRVGDPLDLTIPYVGTPQPEIKWTKNGIEINGIQTNSSTTRYYLPSSKRSDSGPCKIVATNSLGTTEARVLISVIDKPGPPEGPINYLSTTRRTITVAWKPPKDNGGVELTGYRIEYQEVGGQLIWEKVSESTTLLSHMVRNLEHRKQYRFRVFAENIVGLSEPITGDVVTAKDPFDLPGPPGTPEITGYDTNMVELKWNPPRDDGGSPVIGYIIERFEKRGGGDWAPVTALGTVHNIFANVTSLAESETYQFRVCAVNAAGQGPPSKSCEPVQCRPFVEPPTAPDRPRISKVTRNSVALSWMKPIFDGGAPIDGYIIEYRKANENSDWTRENLKTVKDTNYNVEGLPEKEHFKFRIIAVNRAGESEPSKSSDIVCTEDQPGRPILDLSNLKDITVRAGETITFSIPYSSGGLKPTVDAFNGSSAIYEDDRTQVVVLTDNIVFTTTQSIRTDAGPYKLIVQNRFGKDFAKLRVNVLDVPGKPTGPLLYSEISEEAMTLHWSPPKDDGGGFVTNYVVEKKNASSIEWEKIGQPVNLSFRVRNLENGEKYDFRVRAENEYGIGLPLDSDNSILAKNTYDPPSAPGQPEPIITSDDSITLQWQKPLRDGGIPISGYVLEKRLAGNGHWEKAIFGNISKNRCRVTGLQLQQSYDFRVAAVNAAGQSDWSENSVPIVATKSTSRPIISMGMLAHDVIAFVGEPAKILIPYAASPRPEIVWSKNAIPFDERDVRAKIETSDFLTVLNYKKCERIDSGNYLIRMENDFGSDSVNIRFKVVDRPLPPEGPLTADDIGPESCRLFWRPPKDDGGSPITNYILEKNRLGSDVWEKVSSFTRNIDTLVMGLVENECYKFRVFAENQYGISEPLEMAEPVVAKYQFSVPAQPNQPSVRDLDRNWAEVDWEEPANGGSRILGYNLQYRDQNSHKWITANRELITETHFKATSLRDSGEYEFRVIAKNAAGWSKPSPLSNRVQLRQKYGPPGPPQQIHAVSIGANWVTLTWSLPVEDGGSKITGYVVEKRELGTSGWEMTNDYNIQNLEFTVPSLKEYHDYEFRIIAMNLYGRGVPSLPSSPIKIQEMAGSRPSIVVKPENTACPYNKRAVFTCEAVGRPTPTARWLKNGREVPDVARYRVESSQEGIYKFIIKEVWDIDAGDYTCEVSNVFGINTAQATLKVLAPPLIEKQVSNAIYSDGDMVRIKIFFSGSPPFTHRLILNGSEVSRENENIRMVDFDDHLLVTILKLHNHEAGRYEYTISNDSGEASIGFWINVSGLPSAPEGPLQIVEITDHQATILWRPPVHDGGSRITNYILERRDTQRDEWVMVASAIRELNFIASNLFPQHKYEFRVSASNANGQGPPLIADSPIIAQLPFGVPSLPVNASIVDVCTESIVLSWLRPDNDGGSRIRGYMIEKKDSSIVYWQKCTQAPSPSTSLNVNNLIEGRMYDFKIVAVNDAGESEPALITNYNFTPASKGEIPEFVTQLSNQHGSQGGTVTFECEVSGSPKPTVSWFRGTKELFNTSKCTIIDKVTKQAFVINNLQAEDEDEYMCRAVNSLGAKATRAHLKLSTMPRLLVPPRYNLGVEVEKSRCLELKIPYKAYPECTATWVKNNNDKLENGLKYIIETDFRFAILRINNTEREDAGNFNVVIHNTIGSDSASVNVIVNDRPEPPRFPNVENCLDEAVVLSWKPPNLDGGSLVTNYFVEKLEIGGDSSGRWEKCARSRFTYITVEGLRPEHSYQFRISAENKHGVSDACNPTVPITIPALRNKVKTTKYESYGIAKSASVVGRIGTHNETTPNLMTKSFYEGLKTSASSRFLSPNVQSEDYTKWRPSVSSSFYRSFSSHRRIN